MLSYGHGRGGQPSPAAVPNPPRAREATYGVRSASWPPGWRSSLTCPGRRAWCSGAAELVVDCGCLLCLAGTVGVLEAVLRPRRRPSEWATVGASWGTEGRVWPQRWPVGRARRVCRWHEAVLAQLGSAWEGCRRWGTWCTWSGLCRLWVLPVGQGPALGAGRGRHLETSEVSGSAGVSAQRFGEGVFRCGSQTLFPVGIFRWRLGRVGACPSLCGGLCGPRSPAEGSRTPGGRPLACLSFLQTTCGARTRTRGRLWRRRACRPCPCLRRAGRAGCPTSSRTS